MVEVEVMSGLITAVGFPIAVTVFLLYERMNDRKLQTEQLTAQHESTRKVLEKNTEATNKLCIMIGERMK